MPLNLENIRKEDGEFLVKLARTAVDKYITEFTRVEPPPETPPLLSEKSGIFVTIEKITRDLRGVPRRTLRGCIGFPEPLMPLAEATIEAAIAAATQDPRFEPLTPDELGNVVFEVSVLSPPKLIHFSKPEELLEKVKVGRDGIIVEKGLLRGLLLPQVPVEYEWSVEEYLENACIKAGLPPDAWKTSKIKVYTFTARIFAEVYPEGEVIERVLSVD
ncbi:MAG: TIGR00296 family protein [Thermofilaceae archaeon]|nr:TIGR00296 family protein [Thermofilaceae archaeon]MCX8181314.1 TIGR00296 family protein [Thermofilaceae archaeon]MDW8004657.1 TIGR00296 family protein [Thermofilaceae archaeon]